MNTPLLSSKNVATIQSEQFMADYKELTTVFNNFYGPITMCAHSALCEAYDLYEGTKAYRFGVKRLFKEAKQSWREWWAKVKFIFEDRYELYMDYVIQTHEALEPDVMKVYWGVNNSLKRAKTKDADRLAWMITADILTHKVKACHQTFLQEVRQKTSAAILANAFEWADITHLVTVTRDLAHLLHPRDVTLGEDVELGLEILFTHSVNTRLQDEACVNTLTMDEHWDNADEEVKQSVRNTVEHWRKEDAAKQEANRRYWEEKKRKKARKPPISGKAIADKLSERFKVTRA